MGRTYKVACSDEERNALLSAVAYLDRKMTEIKARAGGERRAHRRHGRAQHHPRAAQLQKQRERLDIEGLRLGMAAMEATLIRPRS